MKNRLLFASLLLACNDPGADPDAGPGDAGSAETGLAVLGLGSHSIDFVAVTELANADDWIDTPRDLAVHPVIANQIWVANENTTIAILSGTDTDAPVGDPRGSFGASHFLTRPAGIAFGQPGRMATAPEMDEVTQPSTPEDFMGPTLWPSDADVFDGGHASHLDMLHNSPNSVGIAWEQGNAYWVFDGAHRSLTRYDFVADHGPGGEDHSDAIVERYAEGQVGYVENVSSGLEMDRDAGLLYVADTGNNRIAVLDPNGATRGGWLAPNYDGSEQFMMNGGSLTTLVEGSEVGLERPSGLALADGLVFVTDNATSRIYAFDRDGALVDYLDLSSLIQTGGLMGIDIEPSGDLVIVDAVGSRVFRIGPHQH